VTVSVVGASHRTAPIEVRERMHVDGRAAAGVLETLRRRPGIRECVLLSTCNRSELYLHAEGEAAARSAAVEELASVSGMSPERTAEHLYERHGRDAAAHLFRVTSGLDSLVVGEPQIQGQVSAAYRRAREAGVEAVGAVLHRLFQTALSAGGEVRSRTGVTEGAASVPSAAVQLAGKVFGTLEGRRAVVVGAGEMGELTLSTLLARGVEEAAVASRTVERARATAERTGARAVPYDSVWELLGRTDIVLTSTSAPHPVVTARQMQDLRPESDAALVIIDIAVPRDVEPEVGDLPGVFLYNIDDLQRVVEATERRRNRERGPAEDLLEERVDDFWVWYRAREAVPLIRRIREEAESVRRREIEEALEDVGDLDREERERIHRASRLVLKKILHAPTVGLRELMVREEGDRLLELAAELFDVDDPERPPREAGPETTAGGAPADGARPGEPDRSAGDDAETETRDTDDGEARMQDVGSGR
jgi:glutamyl-tRNA reductase